MGRDLIFLDTETTGLDSDNNEIIEIAVLNSKGKTIYYSKIKPRHIETASEFALNLNGYKGNEKLWDNAPEFKDVAKDIFSFVTEFIVVGQNPKFDLEFIGKEVERSMGSEFRKQIPYGRYIDTKTLIYEHLRPAGIAKFSLVDACKFMRLSSKGAHGAEADARMTYEVYRRLERCGSLRRLYYRMINL